MASQRGNDTDPSRENLRFLALGFILAGLAIGFVSLMLATGAWTLK